MEKGRGCGRPGNKKAWDLDMRRTGGKRECYVEGTRECWEARWQTSEGGGKAIRRVEGHTWKQDGGLCLVGISLIASGGTHSGCI